VARQLSIDLLHVEIQAIGRAPGKLKYAASSESLWGLWTNDSLLSQKARELREATAAEFS
jgi:UDPglucose--hexose-1-phosphate uridylyltransferase